MSELSASPDEKRMELWEHLDELRGRIFRALFVFLAGFGVAYYYSDSVVYFLEKPLLDILPDGEKYLYFTGVTDKFFIYLKVSALAGLILTSPYLFYELWMFVAPALHKNERRFTLPLVFFGSLFFLIGIAFSYWIVIPYGYKFLVEFGGPTERAIITLSEYFSLTLQLMLAIGLIFDLPVVLVLLAKFGVVNAAFLKQHRKYAFVASAVIAGIATPSPDAFTMVLVLVPLYLLYEISIIGVEVFVKPKG